MTIKEFRAKVREIFEQESIDGYTQHKDNSVTVRQGFFYRFGGSEEGLARRITKIFIANEIPISITKIGEEWNSWPKDSYWYVNFKLL